MQPMRSVWLVPVIVVTILIGVFVSVGAFYITSDLEHARIYAWMACKKKTWSVVRNVSSGIN